MLWIVMTISIRCVLFEQRGEQAVPGFVIGEQQVGGVTQPTIERNTYPHIYKQVAYLLWLCVSLPVGREFLCQLCQSCYGWETSKRSNAAFSFVLCDAMCSACYAVARCLYVRLSVTCFETAEHILRWHRNFLLYTTENMLPNDNVSMSVGHPDHVLNVYRWMEHVIR